MKSPRRIPPHNICTSWGGFMPQNVILAKLTIQARENFVPSATGLVRGIAIQEGFGDKEAARLELVAEEACVNVIRHALEGNTQATFDVIVEKRPGQFVLAIEDQGLPFDWRQWERAEGGGIGRKLMQAFTDEIRFLNLGHRGKRLEFIRNFIPSGLGDMAGETPAEDGAPAPFPDDMTIEIRTMNPDEGAPLARCMYRCYGYSYAEQVYYPEKVREIIGSGRQTSLVAVTPDGEFVGHLALMKERLEDMVAEIGQAVVDPRCRGRRIFEKMKRRFIDSSREAGLYGLYSEAVTIHPYTQKGNHALGATETGLMLGYTPRSFMFRSIEEKQSQRLTTALFYLRTNPEPERSVFPPLHHAGMIRAIYEYGGFRRTIEPPPGEPDAPDEAGVVDVKVNADCGRAVMRIRRYGTETAGVIKARLREICLAKVDCIYLDMPLSDPGTARACAAMEMLGFFFSGIIPEVMESGDVLRLQYLNNTAIDPALVVLVSDFAKNLMGYIQAQRA